MDEKRQLEWKLEERDRQLAEAERRLGRERENEMLKAEIEKLQSQAKERDAKLLAQAAPLPTTDVTPLG